MSDAFIWLLASYFGLQILVSAILIVAHRRPADRLGRWTQGTRLCLLAVEAFFFAVVATALAQ